MKATPLVFLMKNFEFDCAARSAPEFALVLMVGVTRKVRLAARDGETLVLQIVRPLCLRLKRWPKTGKRGPSSRHSNLAMSIHSCVQVEPMRHTWVAIATLAIGGARQSVLQLRANR